MSDWRRPLFEVAAVAAELIAVRNAGFDHGALAYPRDDLSLALLCAFNGIAPAQAPNGWRYFPNAQTKAAWGRVADAARAALAA